MVELSIDRHARKLLDLLADLESRNPGAWHSRRELAQVLEKARLNERELFALEMLTKNGLLEAEVVPARANLSEWRYRARQRDMAHEGR